jgi:nucleotide-binding universal stress UspA family protein
MKGVAVMFQRILVPLDGSKHAELAIPVAARLARASGGSIVLAHIVSAIATIESDQKREVTMTQDTASIQTANEAVASTLRVRQSERSRLVAHADTYLHAVEQKYADELQSTHVETDIVEVDSVSTGIVSATRLEHVDLIVMCLQGENFLHHWLFKHLPRQAIRRSAVPVLILNEQGKLLDEPDVAHPFHVLVPLDGSALAEAVLEPIAQLLMALTQPEQHVIVQLLDIIDASHVRDHGNDEHANYERARDEAVAYLKTVAERIQREWRIKPTVISSILLNSEVSETILHQAERVADAHASAGCDLIAMGTHSRDGIQRLIHGSVTEYVLGSTRFPLLVVTPGLPQKHALSTT